MEITIREIDIENQKDFGRCDMSFTATSKLILNAENSKISYAVMETELFIKQYPPHGTDPSEYVGAPDRTIFFAYANDRIVGEVKVRKDWTQYAYISDLAVEKEYRRQGVGRALIQQCIAWAWEKGFPGITLETQDINVPACKLYESCGFVLRGFDTHLYRANNPPLDEVALFWYLLF